MMDMQQLVDVTTGVRFVGDIHEHRPQDGARAADRGQTTQRVTLLLPNTQRLNPPTRLRLPDGTEVRVLGSQLGPSWDSTTLVTCERVNPDLPDEVSIGSLSRGQFDADTNKHAEVFSEHWRGEANITGTDPGVVDSAGERAPLDEVTITLPLTATVEPDLIVEVLASRHPSVRGYRYRMGGEIDSSTADLRRVIAYRLEV